MKIIIAGNLGYIGPSVTAQFRATFPDAELVGFDIGYFAHCLGNAERLPEVQLDRQVFGDIRRFPEALLEGVDVVIDLAAISNDPIGKLFEGATMEINCHAAIRLAEMCKRKGVKNFVYASSCSMYGEASEYPKREGDGLNPLSAYARSKVAAEKGLEPLAGGGLAITCLRFATACGFTPRIRLDLVLNDFVAGALASKQIGILSDGTPWRPMINTKDMARAIEWGARRDPGNGGEFLAVNTGSTEWNNQIKPLADAVAAQVPGAVARVNPRAVPDKRSYRVNFDLFKKLAPNHQPLCDLGGTIAEIKSGLEAMDFDDPDFRNSQFIRLEVLKRQRARGLLNDNLEWIR